MAGHQPLFERHAPVLREALAAINARTFHAHWPEIPSGKIYGETAQADGEAAFRSRLHARFELPGQTPDEWSGSEASPYGFPLGITYPHAAAERTVAAASAARTAWMRLDPEERAGILVEALERMSAHFFEIAFATMHTTGQGFMMAFQASGPHAFDRALEAIALGWHEQTRFPSRTRWDKPMGRTTVSLEKRYRCIGRGVSVVIGCSTFPVWNSFPGIFASLVTGNPVIVKPHPGAVLPVAVCIASFRQTMLDLDVNPDVLQLAVDAATPVTEELVLHPDVRLIDYTGGSAYGERLERLHDKIVFTEKAGVNSVILDSTDVLDDALENLAFSLALYSGQMCTTPQNIFIPRGGVREGDAVIAYDDVVRRLVGKLDALVGNEKLGPGTLGAIQSPLTMERVAAAAASGCAVLRSAAAVAQPGFGDARSLSPLVIEVPADRLDLLQKEQFGPIACVIPTRDTDQSIALAAETARSVGAITFAAWCTEAGTREAIEDALMTAGANVSFNLTGPIWVNQSATFSDFHVSSGNPAGNASLADPAFIVRRFFIAASRMPAS